MSQIIYDSRFLQKYALMDYSLLVIVETNKEWDEKIVARKNKPKPATQEKAEGPNDLSPMKKIKSSDTKQQICCKLHLKLSLSLPWLT